MWLANAAAGSLGSVQQQLTSGTCYCQCGYGITVWEDGSEQSTRQDAICHVAMRLPTAAAAPEVLRSYPFIQAHLERFPRNHATHPRTLSQWGLSQQRMPQSLRADAQARNAATSARRIYANSMSDQCFAWPCRPDSSSASSEPTASAIGRNLDRLLCSKYAIVLSMYYSPVGWQLDITGTSPFRFHLFAAVWPLAES